MHLLAYRHTHPQVAAPPLAAQPGHAVIGRVALGRGAWLGAGSVIRADGHDVRIGDALHFGRGATIHIAHDVYPTIVGHGVCIGADAVVHACTLGNGVVVEEGVVVLDGSVVGDGAVLEAGSIVYPRSVLEGGSLYAGRPAKPVQVLDAAEQAERAQALRARNEAADASWPCRTAATHAGAETFIADTCHLLGDVRLADQASIWFGCRLDARTAPITLGARCNVQDNSVLTAGVAGLSLGDDTTIGHNVVLVDAQVGARCLVGMGSRIAAGTVVGDDSFIAGGSTTAPGQRLEPGWFWAGQPARAVSRIDDAKRGAILRTATVYAHYARDMLAAR